ncbi:MAG: hypothetical protein KAH20_02140 [Methylococcales bacterium]|nr:hypothetical protein [Methylococcales bacterium]
MQEDYSLSEKRKFHIEDAILIFLLILSVTGVAIMDYSTDDGYGYWIIMVFVFALFAILIAWLQSKSQDGDFIKIVKEQSMHWLMSLIVVGGAFLLQKSGQLTAETASLVILLLLSLATMLDGLRIGWRFCLVGLYLGSSSIIRAFYDPFIWIDSIIAITIVVSAFLWEYLMNKRKEA